ncbi:unnamed protein product [Medioppia subpectinata]|uniref:SP-RING-type domain-containing protein n=1 Tax=Medioppia subpectinata TaxID=1979941 RepID=A0A7R9L3H5_9ACAR|nr:unnamed protein product [Medioppia subpectinata]CAG2113725.1 unnamed protein product [Medioppia subpectinata]
MSTSDTEGSSASDTSDKSDTDHKAYAYSDTLTHLSRQLETLVRREATPVPAVASVRPPVATVTTCATSVSSRVSPELQTQEIDSQNLNNDVILDSSSDRSSDIVSNNNSVSVSPPLVTSSSPKVPKSKPQLKSPAVVPVIDVKPTPVVAKPKSPEALAIAPPEPQQPRTFVSILEVRTPDAVPHALYTVKNGQPFTIEAPPKLPHSVRIRVLPSYTTIERIKRLLNSDSDDIETLEQTLKVSLMCPITSQVVIIPSRSINCHHIDCFDINNFFEIVYNKKIDDWKCPKCKQPAKLEQLVIDSQMDHILRMMKALDSSVENITFDKHAVWMPETKRPDNFVSKSSDNKVISLDTSLDEIIDIDDDEEVANDSGSKTNSLLNTYAAKTLASAKSYQKDITTFVQTNKQNDKRAPNAEKEASINNIVQFLTTAEQEVNRSSRPITTHTSTTVGNRQNINLVITRPPGTQNTATAPRNTRVTVRPTNAGHAVVYNRAPTTVNVTNTTASATTSTSSQAAARGDYVFKFANGLVSGIHCKICAIDLNIHNQNPQNILTQHVNNAHHKLMEQKRDQQNATARQSVHQNNSLNNNNNFHNRQQQPQPQQVYNQHYAFGSGATGYANQYPARNPFAPMETPQHFAPNNQMYPSTGYMMPNVVYQQPIAQQPGPQPVPQPAHSAPMYTYQWNNGQQSGYYNGYR